MEDSNPTFLWGLTNALFKLQSAAPGHKNGQIDG
jgi:hypothetical protein